MHDFEVGRAAAVNAQVWTVLQGASTDSGDPVVVRGSAAVDAQVWSCRVLALTVETGVRLAVQLPCPRVLALAVQCFVVKSCSPCLALVQPWCSPSAALVLVQLPSSRVLAPPVWARASFRMHTM